MEGKDKQDMKAIREEMNQQFSQIMPLGQVREECWHQLVRKLPAEFVCLNTRSDIKPLK